MARRLAVIVVALAALTACATTAEYKNGDCHVKVSTKAGQSTSVLVASLADRIAEVCR